MAIKFPWTCPYCNRNATITDSNFSSRIHFFDCDNKDGLLGIETEVTVCPNDDCREYTIIGSLIYAELKGCNYHVLDDKKPLLTWSMRPKSFAKQFPDYIPSAIISDYNEACLIRDLSPKASATLSRRCLQGIIRDYWEIKKSRLVDEINELQNRVDSLTWQAIDSVRSIGNIGAHMEKDIDLIIDVEPTEAQLLIGLIEILIKEWYVARYERTKHLESIKSIANEKAEAKKSTNGNTDGKS